MHCTQLASVGAEQAHWSIQMDSGVRPASLSKCRECYRDVPQASRTPVITGNQKQAQNTQSPKAPETEKQSPKGPETEKQSPKGKKKNKSRKRKKNTKAEKEKRKNKSRNRKTKPKRQKKKTKAETEKQNTKAQKTKTTKCHSLSLVAEILCMTARAITGEP